MEQIKNVIKFKSKKTSNDKEKKNFKEIINNFFASFLQQEHRQRIEIYKQVLDLKTPVFNSDRIANCKVGDFFMIIEDNVWVYDSSKDMKEHYSQAAFYPDFIRQNPNIFEKQTK